MRSLLSPRDYTSAEVFARETERIYRRLWILAAIRPMLAEHLDYRTLDLGGIPVVMQNFHGKVRAFANICRHRLARIQGDEFGNRPLVCPYHHWAYDEAGKLAGVPRNKTLFQFTEKQMEGIRLREFATEVVGGLIFLNLDANPMPLRDQFARELLASLESATARMDGEFIYTRYPGAFNWKTGIENIKDPLHVQCLHREAFPANFDTKAGYDRIPSIDHECSSWRDVALTQATEFWDVPIETPLEHDWYDLVEQLDSKGIYRGIHLFPNANLMIVDGTSFAVQIYNPLAADRTEMQMVVTLTRPTRPFPHKTVVLWEHLRSDMKVLDEDIRCLEALQASMRAATWPAFHGAYESTILDFHSAYLAEMRGR